MDRANIASKGQPNHLNVNKPILVFGLGVGIFDILVLEVGDGGLADAQNSLRDATYEDLTSIPVVQGLVNKLAGKDPNVSVNTSEVSDLGAAVQANALAEDVSNIVLLGVTPLPLVLETPQARQHLAPDRVEKMAGMGLPKIKSSYSTGEPRTTLGSFDLDTELAGQPLPKHFKNIARPDSLLTNLAKRSLKSPGIQDVSTDLEYNIRGLSDERGDEEIETEISVYDDCNIPGKHSVGVEKPTIPTYIPIEYTEATTNLQRVALVEKYREEPVANSSKTAAHGIKGQPVSLLSNQVSLSSNHFKVSAPALVNQNQNQFCRCGCSKSCTCVAFIIHRGVLYIAFDGRTCVENGEIISNSNLKLKTIFPGFFISYTGPTNTFERVCKEIVGRFKFREPDNKSELTDFIKSLLDSSRDNIDFGMVGMGGFFKGKLELFTLSCTPTRVPPVKVTGLTEPLYHVFLGSGQFGLQGLGSGPRKQSFEKMLNRLKKAMIRVMTTDWHSGGFLTIVVIRMIRKRILYEPKDFKNCSSGYEEKRRKVSNSRTDDETAFAPTFLEYCLNNQ